MNNASKVSRTTIRTITLEEHFATPAFLNGPGARIKERPQAAQLLDQLCDLGERRIADMDAAGIDVQVLSLTRPRRGSTRRDRGSEARPRYKRHPCRRGATPPEPFRRVRHLADRVSGNCCRRVGPHGPQTQLQGSSDQRPHPGPLP